MTSPQVVQTRPVPGPADVEPVVHQNLHRTLTGLVTGVPALALALAAWQSWDGLLRPRDLAIFAVLYVVWGLGTIIPGLALLVRRLHDIDHSGFWVFIALVPLIGAIVLFVFTVLGPRPGGARFDR